MLRLFTTLIFLTCFGTLTAQVTDKKYTNALEVNVASIFTQDGAIPSLQYSRIGPKVNFRLGLRANRFSNDVDINETTSLGIRLGLAKQKNFNKVFLTYGLDASYDYFKSSAEFNTSLGTEVLDSKTNTVSLLPFLGVGYQIDDRFSVAVESFSTLSMIYTRNSDNFPGDSARDNFRAKLFENARLFARFHF